MTALVPARTLFPAMILLRALCALLRALVRGMARANAYDAQDPTTTRQPSEPATTYDAGKNLAPGESPCRDVGQLQHLGPTARNAAPTRACIASLNSSATAPKADFPAGALTWASPFDANGNVETTADPALRTR